MNWIFTSLNWYLYLLVLGLVFYPIVQRIFRKFSFDLGYPFAKTGAIIALSYIVYLAGSIRIIPFNRMALFLIVGIFVIVNYLILKKDRKFFTYKVFSAMIFEELLFLASFIFWAYIRSQEPSLKSLEKFMDFGIMNSILRSDYFPSKDIWYTPLPINYYYFGHLSGAVLIRLSNIVPAIGYNLILATIFAQAVTQVFSLVSNAITYYYPKIRRISLGIFGIMTAYIVNLGANLHTIYAFTKGYPNESPVPFWKIFSTYSPQTYWYPNATRFIPFTIHEFPSYSYVVADLHGHVFDIPFVLFTLAVLFTLFSGKWTWRGTLGLGFLTAVHYMTNAFDGPIYILLAVLLLMLVFKTTLKFAGHVAALLASFVAFSLPFSYHFEPFVSGIGLNCPPDFLANIGRLGPFIFEKGNCQASPLWMLGVLWGFFWVSFALLLVNHLLIKKWDKRTEKLDMFFMIILLFGIFLTIIPEFFYIKDIYPQHFRANTMFKLGYQAFIMMGIASGIVFFRLKQSSSLVSKILTAVFAFFTFFVIIYPFFSIPSYYGTLDRKPELDGSKWMKNDYPEDLEIVNYLNKVKGQPVILEAQGDSYSDYERISSYTGLPTVAGWWVHEWLWRGSSNVVGDRIPEVVSLYTSSDIKETLALIDKYKIEYVIISRLERQKYPNLNEEKFAKIGRLVFKSSNGFGALYQVKLHQ
ncbi:MAG: DUF2298 domain-containing protein [Patescibacteria group bacterium]